MVEHNQKVHLARFSLQGLLYLCPECPYRSYESTIRNQHIKDKHANVWMNMPLVYKGEDDEFHCDSCASVYSTQEDLKTHFDFSHRRNDVAKPEQSNDQETTSDSDEEDKPEIPVRKVKTESKETLQVEKKKRTKENDVEEPTRLKKPKLEVVEIEELSVASSSPQTTNEPEPGNSIDILLSAMLQHPSVIYYDYHMLNWMYGTLPIDLWVTNDECKVLFLRLDSHQWDQKPQLDNPLVSASMLRLDAPRNANRNAFLLGFVKSTAEEMAATLLVETNPHMSFWRVG
ncbi:hypothetical protein M3Y94_00022000 [Aphelenchoides besseyi]|nr:hypothetical protein M3Y94_00022000 [Aphelenchoides besseyi]